MIYQMAGHLIRRLNQISVSLFQERMRALGLDLTPVQFAALSCLSANPGVDQATLAGLIAYDRATMGGVIDRLESKGLMSRHISKQDRRARVLELTPAGQMLLDQILPTVQKMQDDILVGLSDAERQQFVQLAAKVARAGNAISRAPLVMRIADHPDN